MSLIGILHQRRKPWTQAVFTVFVLAWLNLMLQQCVMAATAVSAPLPVDAAFGDMSGSGVIPAYVVPAYSGVFDDCSHPTSSDRRECNDEAGCVEPAVLKTGPAVQFRKDSQPGQFMILPVAGSTFDPARRSVASRFFPRTRPLPAGPSLRILYCTYLK